MNSNLFKENSTGLSSQIQLLSEGDCSYKYPFLSVKMDSNSKGNTSDERCFPSREPDKLSKIKDKMSRLSNVQV